MLNKQQIEQFIREGYIKLPDAFPQALASEGRAILWQASGCDPEDPSTWKAPVIRLGDFDEAPFRKAVNTPVLLAAFDQLAGERFWLPRESLGTFPIRFPNAKDPGDTGWHVDASFPGAGAGDIFSWRINILSRGRALLMLFLFSDVDVNDAPTRIRVGSHLAVARILQPYGEGGLSFRDLSEKLAATEGLPEVSATGPAGTVYLCHPFLVHAAQPHSGTRPRFLAQPPLYAAKDFLLHRSDNKYSPIEAAIRLGIGFT